VTTPEHSARDRIADHLLRLGLGATEMTNLLAADRREQRAQFRADSIPPWEAAYDSATFTPYLIGYCNDEAPAKAAALAWYRAHCETDDRLEWEPDPQMATGEWDQWFTLGQYNADGTALATDIVVRHRADGTRAGGDAR
jgi:hypothetical protein